jgi:hypothetical protein
MRSKTGTGTKRPPAAPIFRSSVFSKMNTFVPSAAAVAVLALVIVLPGEESGRPLSYATASILFLILVGAAFTFNRLAVTFDGRQIALRYGIFHKKIAVEDVVSLKAVHIKWWRYGGTGIRLGGGKRGWITGSGPGVEVETRTLTYVANCDRPERLAALVEDFKRAGRA